MADTTDDQNPGVARRSVLRSAAAAGGAALWAVPAVQVLGMSAASAQNTSSTPGVTETPPPGTTPPGTTPPPTGGTTPPDGGTTPPDGGTTPPDGTTPPTHPGATPSGTSTAPQGGTTPAAWGSTPAGGGTPGRGVQGAVADRRLARTGIEVAAFAAAGAGLVAGGVAVSKAGGNGRHAAGGPDATDTPDA